MWISTSTSPYVFMVQYRKLSTWTILPVYLSYVSVVNSFQATSQKLPYFQLLVFFASETEMCTANTLTQPDAKIRADE
jgi:hypothetical protein